MRSLSLASILLLIATLNSVCLQLQKAAPGGPAEALLAPAAASQTGGANSTARPSEHKKQDAKPRPVRVKVAAAAQNARGQASKGNSSLARSTKTFRQQQPDQSARPAATSAHPEPRDTKESPDLEVLSITPRLGVVQTPVESNAILKCLVSAQTSNFSRPFGVKWSRQRFGESTHEAIDKEEPLDSPRLVSLARAAISKRQAPRFDEQDDEPPDWPSGPFDLMAEMRDFLGRVRQETRVISSLLVESTLSISAVQPRDNASYTCKVSNGRTDYNQASVDLVVLSRPDVRLDKVRPARDSKSAIVRWAILADGNTPIKKTILMVRSSRPTSSAGGQVRLGVQRDAADEPRAQFSSIVLEGQEWQRLDIEGDGAAQTPVGDVDVTSPELRWPPWKRRRSRRRRALLLSSLLPGATYQLRLAATNDMGQSDWSQLEATMPNEIPAQITDIFVLSATNDSLTIGWRRPTSDGAKTARYEMQLFDLNRTITLDANTSTSGPARTNFMFHFVNLNPGSDHHFHVRACSRLGCSAWSSPKLAASTLDGEPDEPLDVELACQSSSASASGNLSVTWLPPRELRGRLQNYSVTIESFARYRNQLGQWTSDEWRTTMDTADNHTLALEAGNLLMPNTRYSARVCANNRSRKCGRPSQPTARSSCTTPAELPRELPANIALALRQTKLTDVTQDRQQVESLALELPFISWRNGSIDCIQLVLVRLPRSFEGSRRALSDFLPGDPADVRVADPGDATQAGDGSRALAYLADELDQINQSGSPEEVARGAKQILLGDGIQSSCRALPDRQRPTKAIQAFDGPLIAQTYYTGFLKLLQVRHSEQQEPKPEGELPRARRQAGDGAELLAKYSNYFSPVRTGEHVPQVIRISPASVGANSEPEGAQEPAGASSGPGVCAHTLVQQLQDKLGVSQEPCLAVTKLAETVRRSATRLYQSAASYLRESVGLDSLGQPTGTLELAQRRASPLKIGLAVLLSALLLLFVVYLFTLPARLRRKSRLKTRRKLQQHEQAASVMASQQPAGNEPADLHPNDLKLQQQPPPSGQTSGQRAQQPDLQALTQSLGYQQVPSEHVRVHQSPRQVRPQQLDAGLNLGEPRECPVHSSPMSVELAGPRADAYSPSEDENDAEDGRQFAPAHLHRRQSVHACQQHQQPPEPFEGSHPPSSGQHQYQRQHEHAHHTHNGRLHHRSAYQLDQSDEFEGGQAMARAVDYERNCKTLTRRQLANFSAEQQVSTHHHGAPQQRETACTGNGDLSHLASLGPRDHTLTMQHNTVLALAKKFSKPVPLGLLRAVLETRLKNNWLRDEYEQLPRPSQLAAHSGAQPGKHDGRHLRLRPQLIVSRDDSISALISGDDHYDGSLVKLPMSAPSGNESQPGAPLEKQLICAKSPTDPDSVWDFWRLVYEREVNTLVMLTPNEDAHTGEIRCAQYWPTCDNEETTILSPCNEFVQQSGILPAKFKVRQETLDGAHDGGSDEFVVRRLTLLVMASRPSENEHTSRAPGTPPTTNDDENTSKLAAGSTTGAQSSDNAAGDGVSGAPPAESPSPPAAPSANLETAGEEQDDEERLVIVERTLLHFQFLHWNASSVTNQTKLIRFIELVNERHARSIQQQASPGADWQQMSAQNPMLVHCANGLGRSGLFAAMSFVIDDLGHKLAARTSRAYAQQQMAAKINLFQVVARMRTQRDMLLSPYRFYELLYQLTARCIPNQVHSQLHHRHHHHQHQHQHQHEHGHSHGHNHAYNQAQHR